MIPLAHRDPPNVLIRTQDKVQGWLRLIWSDKSNRNLFLFLLLNFSFAIVELVFGWITNSLGLISDSFHMFFDCTGLIAGLIASLITKWRSNDQYSYGYGRAEVLGGLTNAMLLVFTAFYVMKEAIERAIEPPEVHKHERLFIVSALGFVVNLIGIFVFNHGHGGDCGHGHGHSHGHGHNHDSNHGHSHSHSHNHAHNHHDHGHNHNHHHNAMDDCSRLINIDTEHSHSSGHSQIMKGVFLHILADTLGSVGVIISSILMWMFGWLIADPVCSMFIAILIFISVMPLLKESATILMQRQPKDLDNVLPKCYNKVKQLAGVYSVQEPHFWTLSSNNYIGCLKLEVARTVDPKYVVASTQMIFTAVGVRQLTVQLDYSPL